MSYLFVRHKVKDFDAWKPLYDAHRVARAVAGLKQLYLLRNAADPNDVLLLFETSDLEKARAFARSEDLQQTMKKAGVTGVPEILELQ